ncbi:ABC transporter [Hypoxylon cercidicola]|nr:ABC transporter [Hypoxylon cercidicola]
MAWIMGSVDGITDVSILLSIAFMCWALFQAGIKKGRRPVVAFGIQGYTKAVLSIMLLALSTVRFVSSEHRKFNRTFELLAVGALCGVSWIQHHWSVQPSSMVILYLLWCLIRDGFEALETVEEKRNLLMQDVLLPQLMVEVALLITENYPKGPMKALMYEHEISTEEEASILSRVFFGWINPVLIQGYSNVLLGSELPSIDTKLRSEPIRLAALRAWDQRSKPENKMTLPKVLLGCLKKPFLSAILPRIFLIFFRYSQPILISQAIVYVTSYKLSRQAWTGHRLIVVAAVVYIGLAFSTTAYQHSLNKLRIMIRAALIALIHNKAVNSYAETTSEGRVLTLASTDVDGLDTIGEMCHETWGQILEVTVGIILLSREVGWLFPVPLVIIVLCSRMSQYVARNLRKKQGNWNKATQTRISEISAAIRAIKSVKMLGLQDIISEHVERLRHHELNMASKVRWMNVAYTGSANALGMFAPVLTLVLYAILAQVRGEELDTKTAFTTIAILIMVTHPANMVMTIIPRAVASFASFERIQDFLLEPSRHDRRIDATSSTSTPESGAIRDEPDTASCPAASLTGLSVGESRFALDNINLTVRQGSIVICSGATAAGKTVLGRSILGEVPSIGTVVVSSKRIGYCSQEPWLPNVPIKQIITSFAEDHVAADSMWYEAVVKACCLDKDIAALPGGDEYIVGSRGGNLSGGQRQRLALARAIFSRADILILDDPFSGLDGNTEKKIVENLLGPRSLFKKLGITVFLISNSTQYFPLADEVIFVEEGRIKEQGKWNELASQASRILKMIPREAVAHDNELKAIDNPTQLSQPQRLFDDSTTNIKRKTGDSALYGYYIKAAGRANVLFMAACVASYSFFITFPQYWIKIWTESSSSNNWVFVCGYIALNVMAWISTMGGVWATVILVAPHSGKILHSRLLKTVIGAPMLYFSRTDNGSILNRFSQDLQLVDNQLPSAFSSMTTQVFKLANQAALLFVAQKLLTFTLPLCFAVVYAVQRVYLRTSRQLRLLELESKSLVAIDFLEMMDGLSTIRAFGGLSKVKSQHLHRLDGSQKPLYILLCLQCWLRIVLDLLVAGIAVGVIALAVILKDTTSGGQVGVALNMVLVANATLLRLVESWTNLEISLGAIARIKDLEGEVLSEVKPTETFLPPETWPSSGRIELRGITASYTTEKAALENVSLRIDPGQKLVICGRTGSGKSSLLLALLRLLDLKSGSILIDGVNAGFVPRSIIRERCFVTVPQEPLLLSQQTLRFNVDPPESLSNNTIIGVLSMVRLWQHFSRGLNEYGAIDENAAQLGAILDLTLGSLPPISVGQGQLLALARALLQVHAISASGANPIILLDEATSSLDLETEELMLDIVHEEFTCKGHTVIMVAHRVGAAVSRLREGIDVVVWMKDGKIEKVGGADMVLNTTEQTASEAI